MDTPQAPQQDSTQGNPMPPMPQNMPPMGGNVTSTMSGNGGGESQWGPIVGIIIIIALLVVGGYYYWNEKGAPVTEDSEMTADDIMIKEDPVTQSLETQSDSTSLSSIEADLNATDLEGIDADVSSADLELQ